MTAAREHETIFTLEATPIKYGPGAAADAGWELKRLGVKRALLVTDPGVAAIGHPERIRASIEAEGIEVVVYDRARVEPTLDSFQEAADFARDAEVDGFVSVGGGSSIDTAKVADLITTHPAPVMDYVNPPVGEGRKPPSPLRPHLAIPTTSGTGAEATTVAVLDIPDMKVKTGISHRYLRPAQGIVDPELVRTLPAEVTSSTGLDVICHAAESFLSRPYDERERPASPDERPPYQGANPVADVWSAKALEYGGRYLRRAVADAARPRGARRDDARRDHGRRRLRLGRRAHPARLRLSDRRAQARLPAAGLPGRPPVRPARPLGHRHRARGLPLHLRGGSRAPPAVAGLLAGEAFGDAGGSRHPPRGPARAHARRRRAAWHRRARLHENDVPDLVEGALKQQRLLVGSPRDVTGTTSATSSTRP